MIFILLNMILYFSCGIVGEQRASLGPNRSHSAQNIHRSDRRRWYHFGLSFLDQRLARVRRYGLFDQDI